MKVVILYPTGHRVNITALTPTMTLMNILKLANEKRELTCSLNNYGLKCGAKKIYSSNNDMALQLRLSGIANNTTLEIFELNVPRKEHERIRVALQFPNGQRHIVTTTSTSTLETILKTIPVGLKSFDEVRDTISVTFERRANIKNFNLTLFDLGIYSGSAMLRVNLIDPESFGQIKIEPEKTVEVNTPLKSAEKLIENGPENLNKSEHRPSESNLNSLKIYNVDELNESMKRSDTDDSFFEVTINDVRCIHANQQKANTDQPLLTKKLRDQLKLENEKKFDVSTIRCQFLPPNDQYVFEFSEKSSSTAETIHDQIQSLFKSKIELFTLNPQRSSLDLSKSFFDLKLYPRGKIFCETSSALSVDDFNRFYAKPPSPSTLLDKSTKRDHHRTEPIQFSTPKTKTTSNSPERKVPKWFKLSK